MKRLFCVRNRAKSVVSHDGSGKPLYFPSKVAAKEYRDRLNREFSPDYVVSLGPDHRRYKDR